MKKKKKNRRGKKACAGDKGMEMRGGRKGEPRAETKKKKGFITKRKKRRGERSVRRGAGELTGEGRRADNP